MFVGEGKWHLFSVAQQTTTAATPTDVNIDPPEGDRNTVQCPRETERERKRVVAGVSNV